MQNYLLEKIRCPYCVKTDMQSHENDPGLLTLECECWLVCADCARKYPILNVIPVLTIQEGEKWVDTSVAELPVPPISAS